MKRLLVLAVLTGCASHYAAPPEPAAAPALNVGDSVHLGEWIISLDDPNPDAREYAATELRKVGLYAGPWLFAGAEDPSADRAAACRGLLEELRKLEFEASPRIDEDFGRRLARSLSPGNPLRVTAWWWVARVALLEDARRICPDPTTALADDDADVRRYAAMLYVRLGHEVRKLAAVLADALEDALASPGKFAEWEPVFASLAAAGFDEGELLEVRGKLRKFVERAAGRDEPMPWWNIRAFFHRAGPGAEPLLASVLLYEPAGDLRRLAAISYGGGTEVKGELERAYVAKPNDDLALALGNAGSAAGVKDLAVLLEKSAVGSRDRWAAELALEKATGRWFGNAADGEDARPGQARWRALADKAGPDARVTFSCADGGAMLWRGPGGLEWQVGVGPISMNRITRDEPGWAVFGAKVWDESCADADLLLAWRFSGERFLTFSSLLASGDKSFRARTERMVARAVGAAAGGRAVIEDMDAASAAARAAHGSTRPADRSALSDSRLTEDSRAAAIRRLALGGDEEAAAIAACLDTRPSTLIRRAGYLSLFQLDTESSLFALAEHAGDNETRMSLDGIEDPAAPLLLRIRFSSIGVDRMDEAGRDPAKWEAIVREALKK